MDGARAGALLVKRLTTRPPHGAKVTAQGRAARRRWWTTDPEGPAFEAARRALKAGYGKDAAMIGAGGSIGFVQPFADLLGGAPCLLMGVEDPLCNAHSENESLHLGDFGNGCARRCTCTTSWGSRSSRAAAGRCDACRAHGAEAHYDD